MPTTEGRDQHINTHQRHTKAWRLSRNLFLRGGPSPNPLLGQCCARQQHPTSQGPDPHRQPASCRSASGPRARRARLQRIPRLRRLHPEAFSELPLALPPSPSARSEARPVRTPTQRRRRHQLHYLVPAIYSVDRIQSLAASSAAELRPVHQLQPAAASLAATAQRPPQPLICSGAIMHLQRLRLHLLRRPAAYSVVQRPLLRLLPEDSLATLLAHRARITNLHQTCSVVAQRPLPTRRLKEPRRRQRLAYSLPLGTLCSATRPTRTNLKQPPLPLLRSLCSLFHPQLLQVHLL